MLVATNWRPDSSVRSAPPDNEESAPVVLGSPQNLSRLSEANILTIADWLEGTINKLDIEEQSDKLDIEETSMLSVCPLRKQEGPKEAPTARDPRLANRYPGVGICLP